jgi:hypothetical protein
LKTTFLQQAGLIVSIVMNTNYFGLTGLQSVK